MRDGSGAAGDSFAVVFGVFTPRSRSSSRARSATVTKLNPQMRAFLIAAGVRRSVAVQLTK